MSTDDNNWSDCNTYAKNKNGRLPTEEEARDIRFYGQTNLYIPFFKLT